MIKSNELRVGNLIQIAAVGDTRPMQVTPETIIRVDRFKDLSDIILEPIPLNEDWLMNKIQGVTKHSDSVFRLSSSDGITYEFFKSQLQPESYSVGVVNYQGVTYFAWKVDKIHTLQNIWFNLTGEEINLKR